MNLVDVNLIDVHTHLDMLETSVEDTLNLAKTTNVTQIITIATEPKDHEFVYHTAKKYFPLISCTLGIHPHQAHLWNSQEREKILQWSQSPWVVAIGETGLDYYYEYSPKNIQIKAFEEQLELAAHLNLPVQVHTRDAEQDTLAILSNFKNKISGIIHCFTGTSHFAEKCLDLGFNISFSGVVTFKNAENLRAIVEWLPINCITVETDAPFLTPVPYRGKKNTPAFTFYVAQQIAQIKKINLEELSQITTANTFRIFPKMIPLKNNIFEK